MDWTAIKDLIEGWTQLSRDALHIYAALFIQLAAALLLRKALADLAPWLIVLGVELLNELLDAYGDRIVEQWEVTASAHDLWNTMLIPTTIFLLMRYFPRIGTRAAPAAPVGEPDGGA